MNILQDIIYPCLDEVVETMYLIPKVKKSPELPLIGEKAIFDSLGLVSFILAVEEKIEELAGKSITLANERAMSRKNSPFMTIGSLEDYLKELLLEES